MVYTSRRVVLATGAGALGSALAGCLSDGTDEWEIDDSIPVTSAMMYKGPSCDCCDVYAEYLDDSLQTDVETVVTDDLTAVKEEYGIDTDLHSCHTVKLENYVVEGHVPAEVVATVVKDEPDITGIALPGMPAGSPGMGGTKSETWTVYEIDSDSEQVVYTEL